MTKSSGISKCFGQSSGIFTITPLKLVSLNDQKNTDIQVLVTMSSEITLFSASIRRWLRPQQRHEVVRDARENSFNPTTEIKFDLPEAGNVSLAVYDVLGREVAELASGYHEAGYHSATWNAAGQASGVYFARFVATDASGSVRISKVNKPVIMK
jgi:hypothetical protein